MIDLSARVWTFQASLDGGKRFEIDWALFDRDILPRSLSRRACHLIKLYVVRRFTFSKGHTIRNDFDAFRRFFRWMGPRDYRPEMPKFEWSLLTHTHFRLFLDHGMKTANKGNDFSKLRDFYRWGAFIGDYSDFDRNLALSVKQIRAQGNEKGKAMISRDPLDGPLDPAEQELLIEAFRKDSGNRRDRSIVMLHFELGAEPQSVARLRQGDFHKFEVKAVDRGHSRTLVRYQVDLPRVKKRKENRETIPMGISNELGELLESFQIKQEDCPLFYWLDKDAPENAIRDAMMRFTDHANLISPRTGGRLKLNPRRLRYTKGTEMARLGASIRMIAIALDHTDTQTARVYAKVSSYVTDLLNDSYEGRLAPVVARFQGTVIDKGSRLSRRDGIIPATSPIFPILNVGGIGMCGRDIRADGLCRLAPPLTCYGCNFFAAFRDGPHLEVRNALVQIIPPKGIYTTSISKEGTYPLNRIRRSSLGNLHQFARIEWPILVSNPSHHNELHTFVSELEPKSGASAP